MSGTHKVHDATGVITEFNGLIMDAAGVTAPADGVAGYATGCLFRHTDGSDGTALYVNEGSATSADFNAITVA